MNSFLLLGFFYVCASLGENRSRNATVRVLADGHTLRLQPQTNVIICLMLYVTAMGQIIRVFFLFLTTCSALKWLCIYWTFRCLDDLVLSHLSEEV